MKIRDLLENRFDTQLDGWYLQDKATDQIVAGPFDSKDEAQKKTMRPPMFANHHRYKVVAFGKALKEDSQYMWDIEGGTGKGKKFGSKNATVDDHLSAMKYHSAEHQKAMKEKRDSDARHHGLKYHKHKDQIEALGSMGEIHKESAQINHQRIAVVLGECLEKNNTAGLSTLTEQEMLLVEGVLSSLQSAFSKLKSYFQNISKAHASHQILKGADGKKALDSTGLASDARRYRTLAAQLYNSAGPKTQAAVNVFLSKMGASKLGSGVSLSRNYYKDFIACSLVAGVLSSLTAANGAKQALEYIADKLFGLALTVVSGVPYIDDIKDAASMAKAAVEATNQISSHINGLAGEVERKIGDQGARGHK